MGLTATISKGYVQNEAYVSEPRPTSTGAIVRILSGELQGLEGTIISVHGDNRLLIRLRALQGACVEIDAQSVEYLNPSK